MQHSELGNILRVGRCFDIFRRQQMNNLDLHPGLTLLLGHICRNEGCSQEFLVEKVCLDKTTVAHHLARLEEKGYIERKISSQDARVRLVYPTEKARAIYPQIHESYNIFHEHLLDGLSEEDRREVARLSDLLYQNALKLVKEGQKMSGKEVNA